VPRKGKAYRSLPALACVSTLIGLYERGRVAKDEVFDEITSLHKLIEMVGLRKIGVCSQSERFVLIGGIL